MIGSGDTFTTHVSPVVYPVFSAALRLVAIMPEQTLASERRNILKKHFQDQVVRGLEELVVAVDARVEAFCRISRYGVFDAWSDVGQYADEVNLAEIASFAPVAKVDGNYTFDPTIFFSLVMLKAPPAGAA